MALHVRFTRPAILLQSYPSEWTKVYSARGYLMADPTVAWAFENTGSVAWSALVANDSQGVLAAAAEFGLRFGLTHAIDEGDSRSMASFAHDSRDFAASEIDEIVTLVDNIHSMTLTNRTLDNRTLNAMSRLPVTITQG